MIFYFSATTDFMSNGKRNYLYFFINLLISFIVSFCGCVYNEFLILFFCGLEKETHAQIVERSLIEDDIDDLDEITDNLSAI